MFAHLFWNGSMDTFANLIVWLNIVGAGLSAFFNFKAARTNPAPWQRVRLLIGVYSIIYVIGYLWLLGIGEDILSWSQTMRGVSVLAWPLVWIAPAYVSTRFWKDVRHSIKKIETETGNEK